MITIQQFQDILKSKGLLYSKPTILRFERLGILPKPEVIKQKERFMRIYSDAYVKDAVRKITEYEKHKK